jgi:hypothetical protein
MSHYIDQKKIIFNTNLVIQDGKQSTDYILVSDDNGVVKWDSKTNYVSTKEFDHYIGEWFGGGVVVSVWKENNVEKCLVVAPQDCSFAGTNRWTEGVVPGDPWSVPFYANYPFLGFTVPWSNVNNQTSGASWSVSGASNSNIITTQPGFSTTINPFIDEENNVVSGYSGAAQYALNYINPDLGTGIYNDWYLPAAHEILTLWNNASLVNKVLYEYSQYNSIPLTTTSTTTNTYINLFGVNSSYTNFGYWTSTEASATEAYYLSGNGSLVKGLKLPDSFVMSVSQYKNVRPFRVASDNQVSFNFDAEWMIITYRFYDGKDLDTFTRMIGPSSSTVPSITNWNENLPYSPNVNGGSFASNWLGWAAKRPWVNNQTSVINCYTPGVTSSTNPPAGYYNPAGYGNNVAGTYSILRFGGDNTGPTNGAAYPGNTMDYSGSYESILVNVGAFKFHFPGQSTITIDCRGAWTEVTGTLPVNLSVTMYKGGAPVQTGFSWTIQNSTSTLTLDSIAKKITQTSNNTGTVTPGGTADREAIAKVQFNVVTKIGKIIT